MTYDAKWDDKFIIEDDINEPVSVIKIIKSPLVFYVNITLQKPIVRDPLMPKHTKVKIKQITVNDESTPIELNTSLNDSVNISPKKNL